jgi:hypothetical protein
MGHGKPANRNSEGNKLFTSNPRKLRMMDKAEGKTEGKRDSVLGSH